MTNKEQLVKVQEDIDTMGFDTAMYYQYPEIENKTFQRLRQAYVTAKERLQHYLDKRTKDHNADQQ
jgi:hypothetical protein